MCAFYYKETKASNTFFFQVQKLFVPCTSRSHTHFPLGCLSQHSLIDQDAFILGQRECIVFHRNFLKPEDHLCSLAVVQNQLETHISFTGMLKMAKIKNNMRQKPIIQEIPVCIYLRFKCCSKLKRNGMYHCSIFLRSPFKQIQKMAAYLPLVQFCAVSISDAVLTSQSIVLHDKLSSQKQKSLFNFF